MATTSLVESFQTLQIKAHSCLPFNPGPDFGIASERLAQVDRYLFRLFDQRSDGSMDGIWVKSRDAKQNRFHYDKDVFEREDRREAAQALRRHLQWEGQPKKEDNFVSWSSSLLLVLQYAFYRKAIYPDHKLEDMQLCVVDTTKLPDGAFLSDTVLIEAFSQYDYDPTNRKSLPYLKTLRQSQYYFGEYLSQGALYIEECCAIVSMDSIVSNGLYDLREEFQVAAQSSDQKWAKEVLNLRQVFRSSEAERPSLATEHAGLYALRQEFSLPATKDDRTNVTVIKLREKFYNPSPCHSTETFKIESALHIGDKYGPSWKLPITLAFLALKPGLAWNDGISTALCQFHALPFEYESGIAKYIAGGEAV
ncbi:hypothetical protein MBLNU13_g09405t1 [Cladosporium sp. NU13]